MVCYKNKAIVGLFPEKITMECATLNMMERCITISETRPATRPSFLPFYRWSLYTPEFAASKKWNLKNVLLYYVFCRSSHKGLVT